MIQSGPTSTTTATLLLYVCLFIGACSDSDWFATNVGAHPEWYVAAPYVQIDSDDAVSRLWQGKKRCCVSQHVLDANNREFYKSCVRAINRNRMDDDLVVRCLWLMDIAVDKTRKVRIKQYLLEHFFHHNARTDNCANCMPADIIARVSAELAYFQAQHDTALAVQTLERVLDLRAQQISPWVQVELYTQLGRFYQQTDYTPEKRLRMNQAYESLYRYHQTRPVRPRWAKLTEVYSALNSGPREMRAPEQQD